LIRFRTQSIWAICLAAAMTAGSVHAMDVRNLEVHNDGRHYTVVAQAYLDATPEAIIAVVTDYDHLDRINRTVLSSEYRGPAEEGGDLVYTEIEFCVAFICQDATQLQRVYFSGDDQVLSEPVVDQSDLPDLMQHWWVSAEGEGSTLTYTMSVSAEGFIPPLIGPALVRRALRKVSRRSAEAIERLAQERMAEAESGSAPVTEPEAEAEGDTIEPGS
jgi:hypothetical protein